MTENIFENGGEFCMRGDPEHKPVEWHWFRDTSSAFPVVYYYRKTLQRCTVLGLNERDAAQDLIPTPLQIVPWESPDDVPDGIWIRVKGTTPIFAITAMSPSGGLVFGNASIHWKSLLADYEYHTDRRAKGNWQPCGKVAK